MAAQKVQVELVTPEKLLFSTEVDMIVIPGAEGDFGVLPKHAPMISALRNGVLKTIGDEEGDKEIFVAGGFAEVTEERCTIIAEEAVAVANINVAALEARLTKNKHDIKLAETKEDKQRIQKDIDAANDQLAFAKKKAA